MKYLIVGTGGTGGSIGSFLAMAGKDVTFISRGKNLERFKEEGLFFKSGIKGDHQIKNARFVSEEEYTEKADVIFVCVKGYSVKNILSIIEKAAHEKTVIIPIMNGYNMGATISRDLKLGQALEGCIYISAFVESPGTIVQLGPLFKVVFGQTEGQTVDRSILEAIKNDLADSGVDTTLSSDIQRDTFKKFTFISAYAACGAYYDITAEGMQGDTEYRVTFMDLCKEIEGIGKGLGLNLDVDIVEANLTILHSLTPDTTASMQKDMAAGRKCEMDGLVFQVIRLGKSLGITTPVYDKIGKHFGFEK